ncbi:hypothetical protein ACQ86D_01640 [Streptomyces galilaeus]
MLASTALVFLMVPGLALLMVMTFGSAALICGAISDRVKFGAWMTFTGALTNPLTLLLGRFDSTGTQGFVKMKPRPACPVL